jgi:hypothetical protein
LARYISGIPSMTLTKITDKGNYTLGVDLEGMPEGDYLFEIKNKTNRVLRGLSIGMENIAIFDSEAGTTINTPVAKVSLTNHSKDSSPKLIAYFTQNGWQRIGIQLANLMQKDAQVQLVSFDSGVMFRKMVTGVHSFAETWNMTAMPRTDFFLYVNTNNESILVFMKLKNSKVEIANIQKLKRQTENAPEKTIISLQQ